MPAHIPVTADRSSSAALRRPALGPAPRLGPAWVLLGALLAAVPAHRVAAQAPGRTAAATEAAGTALPRVNLAVEWRWAEATPRRPGAAGAPGAGAVVTSTAGSTAPAQGQLTVRSSAGMAAAAAPALPSRMVLANGGAARLRLAEAIPLQSVQAWREPAGTGAVVVPGFSESVQGFELRVRWPGARSEAEVELEVEQALPAAADALSPVARRERLGTRVWVPLQEWVTVASWAEGAPGAAAAGVEAGTVSTAALGVRSARVLQLRLSALGTP